MTVENDKTDRILDGLSVDVEDYHHTEAFADRIPTSRWQEFPSRVADNTLRTLDLFARKGVRGTFFLLGKVVEENPNLVREIAAAGHEIGCHSYRHQCVWRLSPDEFREDTRRAVRLIEDAGGSSVAGYRAPTFSIVRRTLWALEILLEEGFTYDASVFPIHHDTYGMPQAPRFPFQWEFEGGRTLVEIPSTTVRLLGRNLPVGGGGYLRILPMWYTHWALNRIHKADLSPVAMYFHPWEIDPGQPRLDGRWKSRLRQYINLGRMEGRISDTLDRGNFVPLRDFLAAQKAKGPLPSVLLAQMSEMQTA
jgi:polysaccharide deacetylase family protein (PEP-CTERM system associated)